MHKIIDVGNLHIGDAKLWDDDSLLLAAVYKCNCKCSFWYL